MVWKGMLLWAAAIPLAVSAGAPSGPAAVFHEYVSAVNAGDLPAVDSLIGPSPGRPPRNFCAAELSNRDCLVSYLKNTVVMQHTKLRSLGTTIVGDTVQARLEVRNDLTRAAGVQRFTGTDHVTVREGKIVDFEFVPDRHDRQTILFFKYMRKTLQSQPGGGPPPGSLPGDPAVSR